MNRTRTCEQINWSYIAGFFDGEGSAMILTIKRKREHGYRFRGIIKIAQKTIPILEMIREMLGFGTVIRTHGTPCLQINGSEKLTKFINLVGPYVILKQKQLLVIEELLKLQYRKNSRYSKDEITEMIRLRDKIHTLNAQNNDNAKIPLKYSSEVILNE